MGPRFFVHFRRDLEGEKQTALRARLCARDEVALSFGAEIPEELRGKINLLISGRVSAAHLEACGASLETVVIPWAGLPSETRAAVRGCGREIAVHNLHHNAVATAEMAVTLLLAAAKILVPLDQSLRRGDWSARYAESNATMLLDGKDALILGYGNIGKRVGRILKGLGMRVRGVARSGKGVVDGDGEVEVLGQGELAGLLGEADVLVVCVPLTDETAGMLGVAELGMLRAGAILVNVARGGVIDEAGLYDALASGHLRAAGLDVWYNYPESVADRVETLPGNLPFHELANVVLSPHRGGAVGATEAERLRYDGLAAVVNAAVAGETIPNRVDLELGY